jgi:hypothetical protein
VNSEIRISKLEACVPEAANPKSQAPKYKQEPNNRFQIPNEEEETDSEFQTKNGLDWGLYLVWNLPFFRLVLVCILVLVIWSFGFRIHRLPECSPIVNRHISGWFSWGIRRRLRRR